MKILVALHPCMDLGGIINHTEQLIGGLQDLGHTVHLKEFVWKTKVHGTKKSGDFRYGPSGIPHHQGKGWNWGTRDRVPYRGGAINTAKQILSSYDVVIWTTPVPSKNKDNQGNSDWMELYALEPEVRQIAFIHDGNAVQGNGHLIGIQEHLSGLACVHPCAYNGAAVFDPPRALIVNPQDFSLTHDLEPWSWNEKRPGFVNMQTFKAWKHVHELIEAIAYMPPKRESELREVAGKGIEYQYMTSLDKCKDHYFHSEDAGYVGERYIGGEKFWDAALANGMTHHDYWSTEEMSNWLSQARVLVDPSWSKKYSKVGGHFNRVVVDAMLHGAVPVARRAGMGDEIFQAGVNYIEIPPDASPQEYADIVLGIDMVRWGDIIDNNRPLLPMFDRKIVAQRVIDFAHGNLDDAVLGTGTMSTAQRSSIEDKAFNHFGVII